MIIGIPKEILNNENRVSMIPAGVKALTDQGHQVLVQTKAGLGSGISDEDYILAGATIVMTAKEAWDVQMVVKVKEPQKSEYEFLKPNLIVFTYLHLADKLELTDQLLDSKVIGIAYETIQNADHSLPLLAPMSEVAGRRAISIASYFLEAHHGGKGILLSGVPGVRRSNVVVVGAGIAGLNAAKQAVGIGARVTILDINLDRLRYIDDLYGESITTLYSDEHNLAEVIQKADVVISTVLIPGARAPKIIKEYMVESMEPGSIIVDIAVDQGGSVETIDRLMTLDDPIFVKHGILHYAVPNMPGAVPQTATYALTNATFPYIRKLANKGIKGIFEDQSLIKGLNTIDGRVACVAVGNALNKNVISAADLRDLIEVI